MFNNQYFSGSNQMPNPMQQSTLPPHLLHQQQVQYHQFIQQQSQLQQQQMSRDDSLHKLKRLDDINGMVGKISLLLIQFFDEVIKDKPPTTKSKQIKSIFEEFLKHLKKVEADLLHEINLLSMASTGNPHEGSIYGARKDYDLSKMQLHLISSQINSLRMQLNSPLKEESDDDENSEDGHENGPENLTEAHREHINGNGHIKGHMNGN